MLLRHIPCTLWLLVAASPLASGQKVVPLADDPDYQEGLRALGHELPELAATRFEEALNDRKDDDPGLTDSGFDSSKHSCGTVGGTVNSIN